MGESAVTMLVAVNGLGMGPPLASPDGQTIAKSVASQPKIAVSPLSQALRSATPARGLAG